jgi:hypothetical protein
MTGTRQVRKIVSGGQTGADRGGLDAALRAGVEHGGWCPRGRKAEDGAIPERYRLTESTSDEYVVRTEANVVDSDVTLVFSYGELTGGSLYTAEMCQVHARPCLHVDLETSLPDAVRQVERFLAKQASHRGPLVVNIAGSRGSLAPGISEAVEQIVLEALGTEPGADA